MYTMLPTENAWASVHIVYMDFIVYKFLLTNVGKVVVLLTQRSVWAAQ